MRLQVPPQMSRRSSIMEAFCISFNCSKARVQIVMASFLFASPLVEAGCKGNAGRSSERSSQPEPSPRDSLLDSIRDGRSKLYLDQALALVQTFDKPMVQYGEGCRDLQWSERERRVQREKTLPEELNAIIRDYERVATRKKGFCIKKANNEWSCELVIDDGDEFAISMNFSVDEKMNYIAESMKCSYAG